MTPEVAQFSNRGMNQDISVSKATNEFAFENYNIRITAIDDNTLLSITNERLPKTLSVSLLDKKLTPNKITVRQILTKYIATVERAAEVNISIKLTLVDGTIKTIILKKGSTILSSDLSADIESISYTQSLTDYLYYVGDLPENTRAELSYIKGNYLGHAILNETLVLFTKSDKDYISIFKLNKETNTLEGEIKYSGNLNFSLDNPIETLPYYESELVQKVYWVDGRNQPRVINIVSDNIVERLDNQFDFNPTITKFPEVTITKKYSGVGLFPSGVIQYFVSYYNKYGAETGIVWASDLQYVTEYNRAAGPDETIVCNFKIDISNVDTTYDYARVYSMQRTSLNTTPICRIVGDININNSDSITIIDTNTNTETLDPTQLLFLGGDNFIASTLTQKDDVLFLGDLTIESQDIRNLQTIFSPKEENYESEYVYFSLDRNYDKNNSLEKSENSIKGFKRGEWYRFGVQFQKNDTTWTPPIWVGDKQCPLLSNDNEEYCRIIATFDIEKVYNLYENVSDVLNNYINYRLLLTETSALTRSTIAQGFVNPTVFNYEERNVSGPYALSSWITRARNGNVNFEHLSDTGVEQEDSYVEIQGVTDKKPPVVIPSDIDNSYNCYIISLGLQIGNKINIYYGTAKQEKVEDSYIYSNHNKIFSTTINKASWKTAHSETMILLVDKCGISVDDLTFEQLKSFITNPQNPVSGWSNTNFGFVKYSNYLYNSDYIATKEYPRVLTKIINTTQNSVGLDVVNKRNRFYVDSSIVTFHSPDLENNKTLIDGADLKFKIVGVVPINKYNSDISAEISPGMSKTASLKDENTHFVNNGLLVSDFLYTDFGIKKEDDDFIENTESSEDYKLYMWNKSGSITGSNKLTYKDNEIKESSILKHKIIANKSYSDSSLYWNTQYENANITKPIVFDSSLMEAKKIEYDNDPNPTAPIRSVVYYGNYDKILSFKHGDEYSIYTDVNTYDLKCVDPIRIKYNSTPHAVFGFYTMFKRDYQIPIYEILPQLKGDTESEYTWDISNIYNVDIEELKDSYYPWFEDFSNYSNNIINRSYEFPYLYLCELYRDVDHDELYGDTDNESLEKLKWIPASDATPITNNITNSWGDVYYQRWECLRTYPTTEEDLNSVVDIVSLMVETYTNLDGRYDKNKESENIIYARPDNFNKINPVYSQANNYFTYSILDEKFNQNKYFNQVAFSLQKTPISEIDTWCNISLASAFNLDGKYGKLNKLITVNDAILAFQDKALSVINFNNRTAISTENGVPIEIANSGKVNGYSVIGSNIGCQNKLSICEASSGVYFIDDLNKTMYGFNREGLSNISSKGMSVWFKKNLTGNERCFYDRLTNDVYITNDSKCLVFNEVLDSFTSFMNYNNIHSLFNFEGASLIFNKDLVYGDSPAVRIKKMFEGEYTDNYYIQYKINPEPFIDKTFTNIEFIADKLNNNSIDSIASKKNLLYPFTEFEVWNEYQYGITNLTKGRTYPNFERKFRIWRADIPRDSSNGRDRIRNPWVYLKLSNKDINKSKMTFHSFLVKYYK